MTAYTCWLISAETLSPLVIPRFRGNMSMQQTQDYVPGTTFRGALAYSLARSAVEKGILEEEVFRHFQDDGIKVTSLLPMASAEYYSLPIPLSARKCKFDPSHAYVDFLSSEEANKKSCQWSVGKTEQCEGPFEKPDHGFMSADPEKFALISLKTLATTHVEIEDDHGTSKKDALFSLESIGSGQLFAGGVRFPSDQVETRVWSILSSAEKYTTEWLCGIGQGPARGRGLVKMKAERYESWGKVINLLNSGAIKERIWKINNCVSQEEWNRLQKVKVPLTLLSDAILLTPSFSYHTGLSPADLEKAISIEGVKAELKNAFAACTVVSGWNKEHGRQKVQESAVTMGSSFLFEVAMNSTRQDELLGLLERVEQEGIGIRRHEGFGRVIVAHPFHSKSKWSPEFLDESRSDVLTTVTIDDILAWLPVHIDHEAFRLMNEEFQQRKDRMNHRFLYKCAKESERWYQDACRRGVGLDIANRTARIKEDGITLKGLYVTKSRDQAKGNLKPTKWLSARMSIDWGRFIVERACNSLAEHLESKGITSPEIRLEQKDGHYTLRIVAAELCDQPTVGEQAINWFWQAVQSYFYSLRTRARILSNRNGEA